MINSDGIEQKMSYLKDSQDHEMEGSYAEILRSENEALREKIKELQSERTAKHASEPPAFVRRPPDETI